MNILNGFDFVGEEERIRRFVMPKKIVLQNGRIKNADSLLQKKPLQIGLAEKDLTEITKDGQENPYIVLDFGAEMHGGARLLAFLAECGEGVVPEVRLTFGESLSEAMSEIGERNATNDHAARSFCVPLPNFSDQEWGQTGFRFLKLELLTDHCTVKLKNILGVFIYRDLEKKGAFLCSDDEVNKIYDTSVYTCLLCLQNMLWDGIKRDRLVWAGDMMPECMTAYYTFGDIKVVRNSLNFLRLQHPLPDWMSIRSYTMWWVLIVYDWYKATGNEAFLKENLDYIFGAIKQVCAHIGPDGSHDFLQNDCFLDWPTAHSEAAVYGQRAVMRMMLKAGEEIAERYRNEEIAALCKEKTALLQKAKEKHCGAKQTAAMLSLSGALDKEAAARLIIDSKTVGFSTYMLYFLLTAAENGGKGAEAFQIMKEYLSAMLKMGATTFFEDFHTEWLDENPCRLDELPQKGQKDLHGSFGDHCYIGLRHSLCHGWASGAVPFLVETVLGIKRAEVGYKKVILKPRLFDLEWAEGSVPTPWGVLSVRHTKLQNGQVKTEYSAPKEIEVLLG